MNKHSVALHIALLLAAALVTSLSGCGQRRPPPPPPLPLMVVPPLLDGGFAATDDSGALWGDSGMGPDDAAFPHREVETLVRDGGETHVDPLRKAGVDLERRAHDLPRADGASMEGE